MVYRPTLIILQRIEIIFSKSRQICLVISPFFHKTKVNAILANKLNAKKELEYQKDQYRLEVKVSTKSIH